MRLIDADAAILDARANYGGVHDAVLMEHFLNSQPTITPSPNAPLTLEELLEMDGEPVYIKRIGSDHPDDRAWALVDVGHEFCKTVDGVKAFFEFFGKSWLAYRRKQEEVV